MLFESIRSRSPHLWETLDGIFSRNQQFIASTLLESKKLALSLEQSEIDTLQKLLPFSDSGNSISLKYYPQHGKLLLRIETTDSLVTPRYFEENTPGYFLSGFLKKCIRESSCHSEQERGQQYQKRVNHLLEQKQFHAVWDLDGKWENFWRLSLENGIIDRNGKWNGANHHAVYLGDILADRGMDGFTIMDQIDHLREQAQEEKGNISVIAGNHEEFLLEYLTNQYYNLNNLDTTLYYIENISVARWMKSLNTFGRLDNPQEVLHNMQRTVEGQNILKQLVSLKLAENVGDTLFVHTPPTTEALEMINDRGIDAINDEWRYTLQSMLFKPYGSFNQRTLQGALYQKLARIFLDTSNTTYEDFIERWWSGNRMWTNIFCQDPAIYEKFSRKGLKKIVFWHADVEVPSHISGVQLFPINRSGMKGQG